ncbi:MAG: aldo/keto reductase [Planctomycetaceae bacterium]|jgi:predicted aldo/keto reductase-like oxidoreductase|nr:aldo/keto reductase [Planctomycetaceae bacterium]
MEEKNKNHISRRDILKTLGTGAAVSTAAFAGCGRTNRSSGTAGIDEAAADKMTYRTNPRSGDKVSLLGFGCLRFPLRQRAGGKGTEIDQDVTNTLIDCAVAHGINYFDTAPMYIKGLSETATGIALKRHRRDQFFIATKMSTHEGNPAQRSREGSLAMYHQSFKVLQVDYMDYYLLHGVGLGGMKDYKQRFIDNGILDFLLQERESGRIRNLGWSFHGDIKVFDHLLAQDIKWDFAMIQLNYADWKNASGWNTNAEYLYGELAKRNIPVVVMEPLRGGLLSRLNTVALAKLKQIRPESSPASWGFRYAGTPENVLTVLSGMAFMEHLQENIRTYSPFEPLIEQEYKVLEEVTQLLLRTDLIQCSECQYCMPCPYGLDIPAVFSHYNRCVTDESIPKSSQDANYRRARRIFLIGYDRSVPKLRQASHCIGCGQCQPKCPQGIKISKEMARIDSFVEQLKQEKTF